MQLILARYCIKLLALTAVFFIIPTMAEAAGNEVLSIRMDEPTAERGFVAASADGLFRLHISPLTVPPSTLTIASDEANIYPDRSDFEILSRVYTIDLKSDEAGLPKRPLWVEFAYPLDKQGLKSIAVFDRGINAWVALPVRRIVKDGVIRAAIPWTFGAFALFEDKTKMELGEASWYRYRSCQCAASPDYQRGAKLRVTSLDNSKSIIVRVNDYGPDRLIFPERVIDLDKEAFRQLKNPKHGIVKVLVELVSSG